jgi:hypothetical protein
MSAGDRLLFNGIDAATGKYALPSLSADEVTRIALGEPLDAAEIAALRARFEAANAETLGVAEGVDAEDLAQAGWGVIFARDADPAIRDALRPLLDRRRADASAVSAGRYREVAGADGYRPDETSTAFLGRFGLAPGSLADPDKLPYFLLIVGAPDTIPFRFQYGLDVVCAVGRIAFDTPDDYARYAAAVVAAETSPGARRSAALFGPRNDGDPATALSADHLVGPLAAALPAAAPGDWAFTSFIGPGQATKARLLELLTGPQRPSLLFSAGHGMVFANGDHAQLPHQGALLCQDWPGPKDWAKPIPPDFYLSGSDLSDAAGPGPMIALLFACYGAGTPREDDYIQTAGVAAPIAPSAFLADLPKRMLAHPKAPALAVVGHIERAMSYSFLWPAAGDQIDVFKSPLTALLHGKRVGAALEYLGQRYAALSTALDDARETAGFGDKPDPTQIAMLWTARNDARNYIIVGDPAVRLAASSVL